jgi:hypothetical protein
LFFIYSVFIHLFIIEQQEIVVIGSDTSVRCDTTIHFAQREPNATGLTNSPRWSYNKEDDFIDLVSFSFIVNIAYLFVL